MWGGGRKLVMFYYKKGFTLIELMIVVAIIGILSAIVYPSYQESVRKTKRTDAQAEMMTIAHSLNQFKATRHSYSNATIGNIYGANVTPKTGTPLYNLALTVTASTWTLTATPINTASQNGNGIICLNSEGQKFWSKGATTCSLSATSTW